MYEYLPTYMYMYHVCAWCLQWSQEGVRSPGIGVMNACEPPHGCWEQNLGRLQEQQMLLAPEPSVQSLTL